MASGFRCKSAGVDPGLVIGLGDVTDSFRAVGGLSGHRLAAGRTDLRTNRSLPNRYSSNARWERGSAAQIIWFWRKIAAAQETSWVAGCPQDIGAALTGRLLADSGLGPLAALSPRPAPRLSSSVLSSGKDAWSSTPGGSCAPTPARKPPRSTTTTTPAPVCSPLPWRAALPATPASASPTRRIPPTASSTQASQRSPTPEPASRPATLGP
jgi:hypothetical protein